jgi:hypothetical protein
MKGMIGEVRLGLRQINTEVVQAAKSRDQEGSGSRHFSEMMAAFHAGAAEEFGELEVRYCVACIAMPASAAAKAAGRRGVDCGVCGACPLASLLFPCPCLSVAASMAPLLATPELCFACRAALTRTAVILHHVLPCPPVLYCRPWRSACTAS